MRAIQPNEWGEVLSETPAYYVLRQRGGGESRKYHRRAFTAFKQQPKRYCPPPARLKQIGGSQQTRRAAVTTPAYVPDGGGTQTTRYAGAAEGRPQCSVRFTKTACRRLARARGHSNAPGVCPYAVEGQRESAREREDRAVAVPSRLSSRQLRQARAGVHAAAAASVRLSSCASSRHGTRPPVTPPNPGSAHLFQRACQSSSSSSRHATITKSMSPTAPAGCLSSANVGYSPPPCLIIMSHRRRPRHRREGGSGTNHKQRRNKQSMLSNALHVCL